MSTTILMMAPRAPAKAMTTGRLLRAYLAEAHYESKRMLRAPAFAIPFLVLPVAIYLLFGVVIAAKDIAKNPAVADVLFLGFSTMAVMGPALFGMGVTLAMERDSGLMKLKRALPAPPGAYLLSKMLMSMFFAAVAMALMTTTASLAGQIHLGFGQLALVTPILIAGSVPFCAIGLLIGAYSSGGAAPAFGNLVYLPMMWLSGLFIPLPGVLQKLVVIWPAFHLDQLALHAANVPGFQFEPPATSIVVLVAMTVAFGGAAIRRLARKG
jgi:ABC-2 type transport system permease protein